MSKTKKEVVKSWGQSALNTIGSLVHGTGTALIATGRFMEVCGKKLHGAADRISGPPTPRRSARRSARFVTA